MMRIDSVDKIASYSPVSKDNGAKKTVDEKSKYTTDRVEVASKPSIDQINSAIKDKIIKNEEQQISTEKLDSIKEKISQNQYSVSTDDIVKSLL